MLDLYRIEEGRLVRAEEGNAQVFFFSQLKTKEDYLPLIQDFNIEAHAVRSAMDAEEIARCDAYEQYTVLICKRPHRRAKKGETEIASASDPEESSKDPFRITSLGMFFFKDRLLVVCDEQIAPEDFQTLNLPLRDIRDVGLTLIYRSTLHFYEEFREIQEQVHSIENVIFNSTSDRQLMRIFDLEKSMIHYLNSLGSNNALIERLLHSPELFAFSKKQLAFLKDLLIDSKQCYRQAEVASEIMASLTDTSASLVNNKLSLLMKRLTAISLIFLPINAIAGVGGMSEFTTATAKLGLSMGWSYFFLSVGMAGVAYLTWFLIHRIDHR